MVLTPIAAFHDLGNRGLYLESLGKTLMIIFPDKISATAKAPHAGVENI